MYACARVMIRAALVACLGCALRTSWQSLPPTTRNPHQSTPSAAHCASSCKPADAWVSSQINPVDSQSGGCKSQPASTQHDTIPTARHDTVDHTTTVQHLAAALNGRARPTDQGSRRYGYRATRGVCCSCNQPRLPTKAKHKQLYHLRKEQQPGKHSASSLSASTLSPSTGRF